ncbi:HEAT repeat domain-containing protein [Saltatorellus ferox]|uniref:HEAT repeat domain-containing protein n=1 Tax=Saltatorellus ferox TaxID=2528018 RepID=UPI003AF3507E
MKRFHLPPLVLLAGAVLGFPAETPARPSTGAFSSFDDPAAPKTPLDYFNLIREHKDRTPRNRIEELGQMKTEDALSMLKRSVDEMEGRWGKQYVFSAMRFFMDDPELAPVAIKFAEGAALRRNPTEARAAAGAMVGWGEPAREVLYGVAADGWDEGARAEAIRGIHDLLKERKDGVALRIMLEAFDVPTSGPATLGVEVLGLFRSEEFFREIRKFVGDRSAPIQRLLVVLDAMGTHAAGVDPVVDEGVNDVLEEGLRHRDPVVQYRALLAVARRGGTKAPREVTKLTKSKDESVKRAAIIAALRTQTRDPSGAGGKGGRRIDPLELVESDESAVRQAAAIGLGDRGDEEALGALHRLLRDEDWRVRAEAIRAVIRVRDRSSIPELIEGLDRAEGRFVGDFHAGLVQLTALDLGLAAGRWRIFWEKESETFEVPSPKVVAKAAADRAKRKEDSESAVAFYGINVLSDAFVLVVDTSGSMNAKVGKEKKQTRLDVAKEQMAKTLNRVRDGVLFNVIPFSGNARPLTDGLEPMDEEAREEALAFIEVLREAGGTNIFDSLSAAFEDERVDTIYLLSDGAPSAGEFVDVMSLRAEVERWNSTRGILIHAIAVGQDHPLLRGLAADSGGRYVRVE